MNIPSAQTAERQMQELLFGPSSTTSSSSQPSTAGRAPMQKPQPVRPSSTSAFSAYVPARGLGTTSPTKNTYDSSPDSPPRSFSSAYSKPSYSYSSSPSKTTRDFQSLNRQSPPKISGTLTRPTALSLMTASDYNPGKVEIQSSFHFLILLALLRGKILVLVSGGKVACEPRQHGETGRSSSLPFHANQVKPMEKIKMLK